MFYALAALVLEVFSTDLSAQTQGAAHAWLPERLCFPLRGQLSSKCQCQSLDPFPSKACPFPAKGHALWSPSNLLLLFGAMLSDLQGEKDVFDQLGGLPVQTIFVPVHAVDLLCDPHCLYLQYVAFFFRKTPYLA